MRPRLCSAGTKPPNDSTRITSASAGTEALSVGVVSVAPAGWFPAQALIRNRGTAAASRVPRRRVMPVGRAGRTKGSGLSGDFVRKGGRQRGDPRSLDKGGRTKGGRTKGGRSRVTGPATLIGGGAKSY